MASSKLLRVAVHGTENLAGAGIEASLSREGFDVVGCNESTPGTPAFDVRVVVSMSPADLRSSSVIESPEPHVLAACFDLTPEDATHAIRAGFTSVLDAQCRPDTLISIVQLAADGVSSISPTTLRWMATNASPAVAITAQEREWLVALAGRSTVAQVAAAAGYSERSMYRLLAALYHRLGVDNRVDAIHAAGIRADAGAN